MLWRSPSTAIYAAVKAVEVSITDWMDLTWLTTHSHYLLTWVQLKIKKLQCESIVPYSTRPSTAQQGKVGWHRLVRDRIQSERILNYNLLLLATQASIFYALKLLCNVPRCLFDFAMNNVLALLAKEHPLAWTSQL